MGDERVSEPYAIGTRVLGPFGLGVIVNVRPFIGRALVRYDRPRLIKCYGGAVLIRISNSEVWEQSRFLCLENPKYPQDSPELHDARFDIWEAAYMPFERWAALPEAVRVAS